MPLIVVGALVAFAALVAGLGGVTGAGAAMPAGKPVAERALRFADRADGAVVVTLADSGRLLTVMTGQNGFLRGTMRGLARGRRAHDIGAEPAFLLDRYADGRLILTDPTDGRHIELEAFGSLNEAVFARLLTMTPQAPAARLAGAEPR
jgi:putative photosynthetic complex assembly protein